MLLVPKQLRRAGMTGAVPYYGGRLTPAQAYAASHPPRPTEPAPTPAPSREPRPASTVDPLEALRQLLDNGVITPLEYDDLRARVTP